jgi:hypothetical protein
VFTIKSDHRLSEANYDRALELLNSQFHYSCCPLYMGSSMVDVRRYFPDRHQPLRVGVCKKTEKLIKPEKPEKI